MSRRIKESWRQQRIAHRDGREPSYGNSLLSKRCALSRTAERVQRCVSALNVRLPTDWPFRKTSATYPPGGKAGTL